MKELVTEKRIYTKEVQTHAHTYFQLLFPLKGSMHLKTKTFNKTLKLDHLFLLTPHSLHTFNSTVRNEFLVIDIPENKMTSTWYRRIDQIEDQYIPLTDKWKSIRFLLLDEMAQQNFSAERMNILIDYVAEQFITTTPLPVSVTFLNKHYNEEITVEKLAHIEGFHPSYYTTWFKEQFGMTPSKYIQQVRLEKAASLLTKTDLPILEIALDVGFNHVSSFNRLFSRTFHCTPREYRQKQVTGLAK